MRGGGAAVASQGVPAARVHLPLWRCRLLDARACSLIQNPMRDLATPPVIKLGPEFTDLDAYSERIPYIPDIVFLDHLTVSGNVHFGKDMVLRGTVIIVASEGGRIDLPAGTELENKVVTGSLRVYEH